MTTAAVNERTVSSCSVSVSRFLCTLSQNAGIWTEKYFRSTKCTSKTPWNSVWLCIVMQFIIGVQTSIFYMSMWPYLHSMDPSAEIHFLGWTVAACSLGCSLANPLFGFWNEKTMSVTWPTATGFIICAIGQCLYGLLPLLDSNHRWFMIGARFVTGFGTGCISVLRAYTATASLPKDRLSAISYGTAGWVLGISFGPAIQALFTPIGNGWKLGDLPLNMYTFPVFFMVFVSICSCFAMIIFMKENYAGIQIQTGNKHSPIILPKHDSAPAMVCVWLWTVSCMIATNIEVMSTPVATAMYGWNDSKSVLTNGIIECVTCIVEVFMNFLIGYTRIGRIDKRKQVIFGLCVFIIYHILNYPWPFYPGPLRFIPPGKTSAEKGGCDWSFDWCENSVAVPLPIFTFCFIFLYGVAFPFVGSPSASLYSEILGPRPQGIMQGLYSFAGSAAQFASPILATFLFEYTGYQWVVVIQLAALTAALFLVLLLYNRLVPLKMYSIDYIESNEHI